MSEAELTEWKQKYLYILKKVTYQQKGKSFAEKPHHTQPDQTELELFPMQRFILLQKPV